MITTQSIEDILRDYEENGFHSIKQLCIFRAALGNWNLNKELLRTLPSSHGQIIEEYVKKIERRMHMRLGRDEHLWVVDDLFYYLGRMYR